MKIKLISWGNRTAPWLQQEIAKYTVRFSQSYHWQMHNWPYKGQNGKQRATQVARVLSTRDQVIALDESGDSFSSEQWSNQFTNWGQNGSDLVFLVGCADGLSESEMALTHSSWSLSPLTFPHQWVPLIVVEQIYRAVCWSQHHPYPRN